MLTPVQAKLKELIDRGWTAAAIAREIGVETRTIQRYQSGERRPVLLWAVMASLESLADKAPPKRRYKRKES